MRATLRVVVLGGLVIAGWLLGSGTSHADEDPGQPGTGLIQLISDQDGPASEARSGSWLGVPPTIRSTVDRTLSTALKTSKPRRPARPPIQVDVPKPLDDLTPNVAKPLAPAMKPLTRTLEPVSRSVSRLAPVTRSQQAPADKAAAVASAAPTVWTMAASPTPAPTARPVTAPIPAPVATPAVVLTDVPAHTGVDQAPLATEVIATADTLSGLPEPGNGPTTPFPASPPAISTTPSLNSSSGGGAGGKGIPIVAVNDPWAMADPTPTHRLRYLDASDLPRSSAVEPSTSPD